MVGTMISETDFYIAVGVLGGVLLVTIVLVLVLFVLVLEIRKQKRERQPPGAFDKYEEFKISRAKLRVSDYDQYPVPNMYGDDTSPQERVSRNPLGNQNANFGHNAAIIDELRRNSKQPTQNPPPQQQQLQQKQQQPRQQPPQSQQRQTQAYDIDNKNNFFY